MNFEEAIVELKKGNGITRESYSLILHQNQYYFIYKGKVKFYTGISIMEFTEYFSNNDILAEDWTICKRIDGLVE